MTLPRIYRRALSGAVLLLACQTEVAASTKSADGTPVLYSQISSLAPEHRIVSSGHGAFRSLYLPTHKGLVRLGVQPALQRDPVDMGDMAAIQRFQALEEFPKRLEMDSWRHRELCLLKDFEEEFTVKNILIDRDKAPPAQLRSTNTLYTWDGLAPRVLTDYLAAGLLAPAAAKKYFCAPGQPCAAELTDGVAPSVDWYRQTPVLAKWGGHTDEFAVRRELTRFATEELPKLKQWAGQLDCNYYLVSQVQVGAYDPARKGLALSIELIDRSRPTTGYRPRDPARNYANDANSRFHEVVAPMSAEQAGELLQRLDKARIATLQPFQKAQIEKMSPAQWQQMKSSVLGPTIGFAAVPVQQYWHQISTQPPTMFFDVRDPKVTMFADDRLDEQVLELTMATQRAK
jgi:hypothetical protein